LWLDASASHTRPPAGVTADPAQYGLFGGRVGAEFGWGDLAVSGRYGQALAAGEGRWLQGDATVVTGTRLGPLGVRAVASAFGLRYLDPFSYDAGGLEVRPVVSYEVGPVVVAALPRISYGAWSTDIVEGDLRVLGGDLEARRSFGAVTGGVSAGAVQVDNGVTAGAFARAGGDVLVDRGRWSAALRVQAQRTPLETELGGSIQLTVSAAPGVDLNVYAGRRLRDPLFGTAGSLGLSFSAVVRAVRWSPPPLPAVAAIGERREAGRVVRFAIRAPEATAISVTGDFTGWEPVAMERRPDGWWLATRVLSPGVHHFGFLVDGEWAIPPEAPGVVEDGWGRRNASIVVEP
jgi:hypothetical protein